MTSRSNHNAEVVMMLQSQRGGSYHMPRHLLCGEQTAFQRASDSAFIHDCRADEYQLHKKSVRANHRHCEMSIILSCCDHDIITSSS